MSHAPLGRAAFRARAWKVLELWEFAAHAVFEGG